MPYPTTVDTGQTQDWAVVEGELGTAGTSSVLVANTTYLVGVAPQYSGIMTGIRLRTATATGHGQVGLYDANGNLLGSSASTVLTSGLVTISFTTPTPFSSGRYYLGFWIDNATDTIVRMSTVAGWTAAWNVTATAGAIAASFTPATGLTQNPFKLGLEGIISGGLT